ncbi:MAG: DNA repair protein RadA, partial [Chloroflexota bacterium]
MARAVKTTFVCSQCGARRPRGEGRCSECGEWNALEEEVEAARPPRANGAPRGTARGSRLATAAAEP